MRLPLPSHYPRRYVDFPPWIHDSSLAALGDSPHLQKTLRRSSRWNSTFLTPAGACSQVVTRHYGSPVGARDPANAPLSARYRGRLLRLASRLTPSNPQDVILSSMTPRSTGPPSNQVVLPPTSWGPALPCWSHNPRTCHGGASPHPGRWID